MPAGPANGRIATGKGHQARSPNPRYRPLRKTSGRDAGRPASFSGRCGLSANSCTTQTHHRRRRDDDRRPEMRIPPRTRPRVPSSVRAVWAMGMAGLWCSSRIASRSRRVSRRETQGGIQTEATHRRGGLCVDIRVAPIGARSFSSGSVIVQSAPRRLRAPARAYSMAHPNI